MASQLFSSTQNVQPQPQISDKDSEIQVVEEIIELETGEVQNETISDNVDEDTTSHSLEPLERLSEEGSVTPDTGNTSTGAPGSKAKSFKCNSCGKEFTLGDSLKRHVRRYHGTTFPCDICNEHFRNEFSLLSHKKSHNKDFTCDECGKSFKKLDSLRKHQDRDHIKLVGYSCPECGKIFDKESSMKKHVFKAHKKSQRPASTEQEPHAENRNQTGQEIDENEALSEPNLDMNIDP